MICSGGSVPSGTYSSLVIAGPCSIDSGAVIVQQNVKVLAGADLYAAFAGSPLRVGTNLNVGLGAVLVLGCEPFAFTCFNDDPNNPTMHTNDVVLGVLTAEGALAVLAHHNRLGGVVSSSGGGGFNCTPQPALMGSPAYGTYEDNVIEADVSITGWHSCWLGFFRNTVSSSGNTVDVNYFNNATRDPDGNEVATNTIFGNLRCGGNTPAPQIGDSGGSLNRVTGTTTGQCVGLVGP